MRLRLLMSSVVIAGAGTALGQTTAIPRQTTANTTATQQPDQTAAPHHPGQSQQQPGPAPASTDLLRQNGNSLFKASIATRVASVTPVDIKDISYFAVPVPQPKVIRKHDLVTIIIREESQFTSDGSTNTKRESKLDAAITDFINFKLANLEIEGGGIGPVPPKVAGNLNREFKGQGTVDRTDKFTARITAEVLDIKPNGTLVVQARKRIKTDEEEQAFILTGVCRAEDITADNSILSTQMYDLELSKSNKGTVRNATRKGWGGKLLDAISPF